MTATGQLQLFSIRDETVFHLFPLFHHLRWKVFCRQLRWHAGLFQVGQMEFDKYDYANADIHYIALINNAGAVDALCRLMPTHLPYMLGERYPGFIQTRAVPQEEQIVEITRFCVNPDLSREAKGRIIPRMFIALFEYGLLKGITGYVSLTTHLLVRMFESKGLVLERLGPSLKTPDDYSQALWYPVTAANMEITRAANLIDGPVLFDKYGMPFA